MRKVGSMGAAKTIRPPNESSPTCRKHQWHHGTASGPSPPWEPPILCVFFASHTPGSRAMDDDGVQRRAPHAPGGAAFSLLQSIGLKSPLRPVDPRLSVAPASVRWPESAVRGRESHRLVRRAATGMGPGRAGSGRRSIEEGRSYPRSGARPRDTAPVRLRHMPTGVQDAFHPSRRGRLWHRASATRFPPRAPQGLPLSREQALLPQDLDVPVSVDGTIGESPALIRAEIQVPGNMAVRLLLVRTAPDAEPGDLDALVRDDHRDVLSSSAGLLAPGLLRRPEFPSDLIGVLPRDDVGHVSTHFSRIRLIRICFCLSGPGPRA